MFYFQTAKQFTDKSKECKETGSILDSIRSSRRCAVKSWTRLVPDVTHLWENHWRSFHSKWVGLHHYNKCNKALVFAFVYNCGSQTP